MEKTMSEELKRNEVPCEPAGDEPIDAQYALIGWLAITSAILILGTALPCPSA